MLISLAAPENTVTKFNTLTTAADSLPTPFHWQAYHVNVIDWLSQHSIGYLGDNFTGQKTQSTVSKYWRRKDATKIRKTQKKQTTQNTATQERDKHTKNTAKPLVYNNMGWLGDSSHRGQGCQAWTVVGLPPRYLRKIIQHLKSSYKLSFIIIIIIIITRQRKLQVSLLLHSSVEFCFSWPWRSQQVTYTPYSWFFLQHI